MRVWRGHTWLVVIVHVREFSLYNCYSGERYIFFLLSRQKKMNDFSRKLVVHGTRHVVPKIVIYKEDQVVHLSHSEKACHKYVKENGGHMISLNAIRACLNSNIPTPAHVRIIDDVSGACVYNNEEVFKFKRIAGRHRDRHRSE